MVVLQWPHPSDRCSPFIWWLLAAVTTSDCFRLDVVMKCLQEQVVQFRSIGWPLAARKLHDGICDCWRLDGSSLWPKNMWKSNCSSPVSLFWPIPAVDLCDGTSYCFRLDAVADKIPARAAAEDPGALPQWCQWPPDLLPSGQPQLPGRHGACRQTVGLLYTPGQTHVQCESRSW